MSAVAAEAPVAASERVQTRLFVGLVVAVTVLPFLAVPLLTETTLLTEHGAALVFGLLLVTGAHQQSSWYLYFDRDSRKITFAHPVFFFVAPFAILGLCVSFFVWAPLAVYPYFWLLWGVVSIHHFQKQNLGVFGLLAPVVGGGRMSARERVLIRAGGVCGMLVFGYPLSRSVLGGTVFVSLEPFLFQVAIVGLAGLALATVATGLAASEAGAQEPTGAAPRSLARTALLLVLVTYYWPLFFIESPLTAFAMFSGGHGLQYLVIMGFVAAGNERARQLAGGRQALDVTMQLLSVLAFGAVTWLLVAALRDVGDVANVLGSVATDGTLRAGAAVILSTTLVHYWVDARVWRLSKADSRAFVQRKLGFLF